MTGMPIRSSTPGTLSTPPSDAVARRRVAEIPHSTVRFLAAAIIDYLAGPHDDARRDVLASCAMRDLQHYLEIEVPQRQRVEAYEATLRVLSGVECEEEDEG